MPIESTRFSSAPPLRECARAYVVDTFTSIDGKAPSDEAVERATELVYRAFAHLEESSVEPRSQTELGQPRMKRQIRVSGVGRGTST